MRRLSAAILALVLVSTMAGQSLANEFGGKPLATRPTVLLEALNDTGAPIEGVMITIRSLTGGPKEVFRGMTDKKGQVSFTSEVDTSVAATAPGNIVDGVYEAYYVAPDGDIKVETFSVPYVKPGASVAATDLIKLEANRAKHLGTKMKTKLTTIAQPSTTGDVGVLALGCTPLGYDATVCVEDEQWYNKDTKVGVAHVASGEKLEFTFEDAAKVNIGIGYKGSSSPPESGWEANGSVGLSTSTSAAVDHTITGTCYFDGIDYRCDLARNLYVRYEYLYQKKSYYYKGAYLRSEHEVKPTRLLGPSSIVDWWYDSRDGAPVSEVSKTTNPPYGGAFPITSTNSITLRNSTEKSFSFAVTIPTPVGAFSPGVSTSYTTSHSYKYSNPTTSTVFWHYDWDRSGANWYVTH